MRGAFTTLRCKGCVKTAKTNAVRPEDWPRGWFLEEGFVWHSKKCLKEFEARLSAGVALGVNAEVLSAGSSVRLVDLANTVIKESGSKSGAHCNLAFLVLRLFDSEEE